MKKPRTVKQLVKPVRLEPQPNGSVRAIYRIADLTLDPRNANIHQPADLKLLTNSVTAYRQQKPVIIDEDGVVRAGNGTTMVLRDSGKTEVWCELSDLTPEQLAGYSLADNKTGKASSLDDSIAAETIRWMMERGEPVEPTGYDLKEIEKIIAGAVEVARPKLSPMSVLPPPSMAWVLIGIPMDKYGRIDALVAQLASIDHVFLETTYNNASLLYENED